MFFSEGEKGFVLCFVVTRSEPDIWMVDFGSDFVYLMNKESVNVLWSYCDFLEVVFRF